MEILNISTQRLHIRNLELKDLHNFHVYRSKPEITKYQGFDVLSMEEAENFILEQTLKKYGKPGEWVQYGIEKIETGQLIGDCAIKLQFENERIAEIGITISHHEQKKGYAKEVFLGLMTFLFEEKGLEKIEEIVDTENIASVKLITGIGFKQVGPPVENIFFKGKWGSEFHYAMDKHDWDKLKTSSLIL